MELLQLRYFVEIARNESVKKASEQLLVSQPSLSQSMKRLEKELGAPLFRHEGRNIRLTEQGRRFFLRAERALQELDVGCGEIDKKIVQGNVAIGTYMPISPILDCIKAFSTEHPQITFGLYTVAGGLQSFNSQKLDVLLYYGRSDHLDFHEYVKISQVGRRFVVPTSHPKAEQETLTMNDLENDTFVSMVWGTNQLEELFQDYYHADLLPHIRYRTNSFRIKNELLDAGLAVGSSNELLTSYLHQGKNCKVVLQEGEPEAIYLGWRTESYLSSAALIFVQFCKEWFNLRAHLPSVGTLLRASTNRK